MNTTRTAKKIFTVVCLFSGLLFSGCTKDLEEEVYSFVAVPNFWKTAADAEAGIKGVYASFYPLMNSNYWVVLEQPADFTTINRNDTHQQLDRWDLPSNHPFVTDLWNAMYQQIARANGVIANVPGINMPDAAKKGVLGEAKFLRAFDYFTIVRMFGAAPLALTVVQGADSASLPKTPVDAIYAQIEKDLKEAEVELPATRSGAETGRATAGAARTLLAWVYLTQKKWQLASDKAKEVMSSGRYSLQAKFGDVFSVTNKNNSEIIFAVQFDGSTRGSNLSSFANIGGSNSPYAANGALVWSVDPKSDIWTKWDVTEDRRNYSVYSSVVGRNGNLITADPNFPSYGKWRDPTEPNQNSCKINPPLLRYADVLFIFAEAEAQAKGSPTPEAYEALNQTIRRAYALPVTATSAKDVSGLSLQAFTDKIIEQRGFEFTMEGKRLYDLMRTGIFPAKIKEVGKPAPRGNLFPIPQSEIDANEAISSSDQNPGY
ncbi:RagB/SusD family nutrient uptake outer membrane protein [Flavitalea antarctica]